MTYVSRVMRLSLKLKHEETYLWLMQGFAYLYVSMQHKVLLEIVWSA